ncbi:unnamed protein product [Arctia plantaginis]|uniref:Uncharacterized protein n=1 Tax=Arctia plantaginis TaxID=874455 RepID=A0A8S0ZVI9_ARCPL|nr:unnamed protein product [Arctia plantaginis]
MRKLFELKTRPVRDESDYLPDTAKDGRITNADNLYPCQTGTQLSKPQVGRWSHIKFRLRTHTWHFATAVTETLGTEWLT